MTIKELAAVSVNTLLIAQGTAPVEVNAYGGEDWVNSARSCKRYGSVYSIPEDLAQAEISAITTGSNNNIVVFLKEG